jgi:hypothetical protein
MIRHCVMLRLAADADRARLTWVIQELHRVVERLDGASGLLTGPNRDFEDKTADYPYGFTIDFESADALAAYAADPDHAALGAQLVAMCSGGAEGIRVYDIEMDVVAS